MREGGGGKPFLKKLDFLLWGENSKLEGLDFFVDFFFQ